MRKTGRDGEMMRGPHRIVEETQGDPAGMEFGVDAGFVRFRRLFVADFISGRRIAGIEQLAGQKPPLDPPSIAVDQHGGVAWRGEHERGRLNDLVLMPQLMDSGVEESRIVPQVRRHGVEHRVGCRIVVRGSEQARQDDFVRPREHGIAQAARIVFLIEQAVRARLIIRRAEIGAEFAAHMRFERRHQIGMAPDIAHQRLRFGVLALLAQGAGLRQFAERSLRLARGEEIVDQDRVGMVLVKAGFDPPDKEIARRPIGMRNEKGVEAVLPRIARIAQRDPFERGADDRIGDARGLGVALRQIAGLIIGKRLAQAGEVEAELLADIDWREGRAFPPAVSGPCARPDSANCSSPAMASFSNEPNQETIWARAGAVPSKSGSGRTIQVRLIAVRPRPSPQTTHGKRSAWRRAAM